MAAEVRPTDYRPEIGEEICRRVELGETIRQICGDAHMPDRATVYRWLAAQKDFRDQYAPAREESGHVSADDVVDISRQVLNGEITPEQGRVAIDAAKWTAGKRKPKVYGDKLDVEQSGNITIEIVKFGGG